MSLKSKKISLSYLIETLKVASEATQNDFMEYAGTNTECIEKALEFLVKFDLLNSTKIDFDNKAKDNGSN